LDTVQGVKSKSIISGNLYHRKRLEQYYEHEINCIQTIMY